MEKGRCVLLKTNNIENNFFWSIDKETGFRKLILHYETVFIKESEKFSNYNGVTKRCPHCGRTLPAVTYYFASGGITRKDGLHGYCKECEGSHFGWGRVKNQELQNLGLKYCAKCDRILPLNEIYFSKSSGRCNVKTGYTSNCKECTNTSFGFSSLNDKRDLFGIKDGYKICQTCMLELPDTSAYFFSKKDRIFGAVRCKKCSPRHTEYGNSMPNVSRKNELKDGEAFCTKCQNIFQEKDLVRYGASSPMCRECARKVSQYDYEKRRNLRNKLVSDLTRDEWEETLNYFNHECSYCGMSEEQSRNKFNKNLAQDHVIPLTKGGAYSKCNIVPACMSCNAAKSNHDLMHFYDSEPRFTKDRLKKIINFIEIYSRKPLAS